jgi:hypothetical protein
VPVVPAEPAQSPAAAGGDPRGPQKLEARIAALDFTKPDVIDQDAHNRQTWREARPGEPYPAKFAGAHGRGLKALGLSLSDLDRG